ncbi:unnamed protein product [Tuber aestivum]|uniref:Uncharacterized protein n=1 Tax=Tuber aestivum TaxID=59557 RepID=A0A292Q804_9PEZI|nr:unnamed protein product [Tuber aestivum]
MGTGTPMRRRGQASCPRTVTTPSSSSSSSSGSTIRPHYQLHYNPHHHQRHHHHHHPTPSMSPITTTTPSSSSSSSTSSHASTHPTLSPALPYNTPIDWKGNAARRAEYAALDRRVAMTGVVCGAIGLHCRRRRRRARPVKMLGGRMRRRKGGQGLGFGSD